LAAAIIARAIPVFPLVGSRTVIPGRSFPAFSAQVIIYSAGRSFTDPPGLQYSNFASSLTRGLGLIRLSSAIGVFPIAESINVILFSLLEHLNLLFWRPF
jgi:hypothetical protein